jgi:hypothetical protein
MSLFYTRENYKCFYFTRRAPRTSSIKAHSLPSYKNEHILHIHDDHHHLQARKNERKKENVVDSKRQKMKFIANDSTCDATLEKCIGRKCFFFFARSHKHHILFCCRCWCCCCFLFRKKKKNWKWASWEFDAEFPTTTKKNINFLFSFSNWKSRSYGENEVIHWVMMKWNELNSFPKVANNYVCVWMFFSYMDGWMKKNTIGGNDLGNRYIFYFIFCLTTIYCTCLHDRNIGFITMIEL